MMTGLQHGLTEKRMLWAEAVWRSKTRGCNLILSFTFSSDPRSREDESSRWTQRSPWGLIMKSFGSHKKWLILHGMPSHWWTLMKINITLIVFYKDQSVFISRIDFSGAKF